MTNLGDTVTKEDIIELFGVIGALKGVEILTPVTAVVVFVNKSHAAKAIRTYHNRLLDGQPMMCYIADNDPRLKTIAESFKGRTRSSSVSRTEGYNSEPDGTTLLVSSTEVPTYDVRND